ncbi:MAG: archaeosortase/exosortase family protein [Burkholderiaceae bacterium]
MEPRISVAPTSAWLIWRRRADLRAVDHRPDWPVGALVVLAGLAWTVGAVANANSPMQFSLIASFIAAIVMVVGRDAARKVAFALAFLLFAVPFGDFWSRR